MDISMDIHIRGKPAPHTLPSPHLTSTRIFPTSSS